MSIRLPWPQIETVLLDMDGTLLDLRFDNYFWRELIPARYADRHGLPLTQAHTEVQMRTRAVEGTLAWYCLDYWAQELQLEIVALKREIEHLIAVQPYALTFLQALRQAHKRVVLVTNAHPHSLALKMEKTQLTGYFDSLVCAHTFGLVKEQAAFWPRLQEVETFEPAATLLIDDQPAILRAAGRYGIGHLLSVQRPDSTQPLKPPTEFSAIDDFSDLLPLG